MTEPELLASGPDRRLPPAVRKAMPVALAALLFAGVLALAAHGSGHGSHKPRAERAVATPVALPSTGPGPAAAPITADISRVVVDPATHRLRVIFTVFNAQTTRAVLLHVGRNSVGLVLRSRSFARFGAAGSWRPARLPLVLEPPQSAHLTLDYGVRRCPPADAVRLRVPAILAARERGRISVDLVDLVSPRDWPRGLINLLCPSSSR